MVYEPYDEEALVPLDKDLVRFTGENMLAVPRLAAGSNRMSGAAMAVAAAFKLAGETNMAGGGIVLPKGLARWIDVRGGSARPIAVDELPVDHRVMAAIGAAPAIVGEIAPVDVAFLAVDDVIRWEVPRVTSVSGPDPIWTLGISYPEQTPDVRGLSQVRGEVTVWGQGALVALGLGPDLDLQSGFAQIITTWEGRDGPLQLTWAVPIPVTEMEDRPREHLREEFRWAIGRNAGG